MIPEFETQDRTSELSFFGLAGFGGIALVWGVFQMEFASRIDALVLAAFVGSTLAIFWKGWSDRKLRLRKLADRQKTLQALHEALNTND